MLRVYKSNVKPFDHAHALHELSRQNADLQEEVKQLRAAVLIYKELAAMRNDPPRAA